MKKSIALIMVLCLSHSYSQSNYQKFKKLSAPKKRWVILHPSKASKALRISKETKLLADSIGRTNVLDKDKSGGQVDAFRHAYWMARLHQEIGKSAARSLGKAHEKENYLMYKKIQLEEGIVPDKVSSEMDLFNNDVGLSLTRKGIEVSKKSIVYKVINAITTGKMKIIKKNKKGDFLTCNGIIIKKESLKKKWKNNKCLVTSNYRRN